MKKCLQLFYNIGIAKPGERWQRDSKEYITGGITWKF